MTISLIPHTVDYSVIGQKGVGDIVNIECDMIGKYIERFTRREEAPPKSSLTASFFYKNTDICKKGEIAMFHTVEEALYDLKAGKPIIVCDDEKS
ncbi:hypothetical protein GCM10020331_042080 [Ectobacillus funiculus]